MKQYWADRKAREEAAQHTGVYDSFGNEAPAARGRPPQRQPMRTELRSGEVRGRDGEILTRSRTSAHGYINEFDVPEHMKDPNWDLMWARTAAHGKPDPANMNALYDNGWRPASHKNYPKIMPDLKSETIERDGLMLMERPMELSMQSLAEAREDALELREAQADQFGKRKLPRGFDRGYKARNRDGSTMDATVRLNRSREAAPAYTKPTYEYAQPGDDD